MDVNAMLTNAYKAEESRVYAANAVTDGSHGREPGGRRKEGLLCSNRAGWLSECHMKSEEAATRQRFAHIPIPNPGRSGDHVFVAAPDMDTLSPVNFPRAKQPESSQKTSS